MNMAATLFEPLATEAIPVRASGAEICALLQKLSAELLANKSATVVLEKWCANHFIADGAMIVAQPLGGSNCAPSADTRARLKVDDDAIVTYRNVALMCGDILLSVAQNWYVPERLTPAMIEVLRSSETPFGKVIAPLNPTRQTLSATLLWEPPSGMNAATTIPDHLLEHRAVLSNGAGVPLAEVVETYQRGILGMWSGLR